MLTAANQQGIREEADEAADHFRWHRRGKTARGRWKRMRGLCPIIDVITSLYYCSCCSSRTGMACGSNC